MHLNLQINFIIKPSLPLGNVTTMCNFHQVPIILDPPTAIYPTVPFLADFARILAKSARNGTVGYIVVGGV